MNDSPPAWKTIAGVMLGSFVYVVLLDAWRNKATGWDLVDAMAAFAAAVWIANRETNRRTV